MPYGNLERQAVQRLADWDDLQRFECTVEEREEYAPYIECAQVVFAGVDYERIVRAAEQEADVLIWDGGNNDYAFLVPDLSIVVADALRSGHETEYYPGETNLRAADVVVINKVGAAKTGVVERMMGDIQRVNPTAVLIQSDLEVQLEGSETLRGKKALVVEDGPTLTHGGMSYGAGTIAARRGRAARIVDPRPFAVGSIAEALRNWPHLGDVLPALGYSAQQLQDLAETIRRSDADVVVDASPARLDRLIQVEKPLLRVTYRFRQVAGPSLLELVDQFLAEAGGRE
jgi:predicted GTPase